MERERARMQLSSSLHQLTPPDSCLPQQEVREAGSRRSGSQPQPRRDRRKGAVPDLTLALTPRRPGPALSGPEQSLLQVQGKRAWWGLGRALAGFLLLYCLLLWSPAEALSHPFPLGPGTETACLPRPQAGLASFPPLAPGTPPWLWPHGFRSQWLPHS